jgi:hypothetical protein
LDLSQRTITLAGAAMIIAAILTVVTVGLTAASGSEKSPFERDEVAEFLTDTADNADTLQAAGAVGIANDGVFVISVGAAFFVLFRDRSRLLATMALVGVASAAAISLVVDISNILLAEIAKDYVEGGPGDVAAGDSASLELGRYVGMITFAFTNLLFTPAGLAFTSIGLLLTGAPQGKINPPKWIGWVAIIAGLSAWLAWLVVAAEPFFVFFPIQLLSTLIFLLALGIWLLRHSDLEGSLSAAT